MWRKGSQRALRKPNPPPSQSRQLRKLVLQNRQKQHRFPRQQRLRPSVQLSWQSHRCQPSPVKASRDPSSHCGSLSRSPRQHQRQHQRWQLQATRRQSLRHLLLLKLRQQPLPPSPSPRLSTAGAWESESSVHLPSLLQRQNPRPRRRHLPVKQPPQSDQHPASPWRWMCTEARRCRQKQLAS